MCGGVGDLQGRWCGRRRLHAIRPRCVCKGGSLGVKGVFGEDIMGGFVRKPTVAKGLQVGLTAPLVAP